MTKPDDGPPVETQELQKQILSYQEPPKQSTRYYNFAYRIHPHLYRPLIHLLLSGDIETNPGPPGRNKKEKYSLVFSLA